MSAYSSRVAAACVALIEMWRKQGKHNVVVENTLEAQRTLMLSLSERVKQLEADRNSLLAGLEDVARNANEPK